MKIGDLARQTDTPVATIRFYEREGLLPAPARTASNYRRYDATHVERLRFIRHCRNLDMGLDEIRALLRFKDHPEEDCGSVNALLDAHIGHVAERIRELRALQRQLMALRAACPTVQDTTRRCGILSELSRPEAGPPHAADAAVGGHVQGTHGRRKWARATHG
jgi:Cd(II)/Pb(II)-responsive transcriptional regulator